ncbi:carbohydrate sulfotransferase 15-like isoform X2 [Antedon mediterranea]
MKGKFVSELDIPTSLRHIIGKQILQSIPQVFSSKFKNPCWETKQSLRCLPYFYVAGMPKSGTTDLFSKINSHPDVVHSVKELHWWTRRRFNAGLSWYLNKQSRIVRLLDKKTADAARLVIGEGSASTLWDCNNYKTTKYSNADIFEVVQPNAKVIAIFRNPADRLYSGYKYFGRRKGDSRSPEKFHSYCLTAVNSLTKCLQTYGERQCVYRSESAALGGRIHVGLYNIFVRDWLNVFPHKNLYFLRTDEWMNCTIAFPKIVEFLELGEMSKKQIVSICNTRRMNTLTVAKQIGPMLPKTRALLNEFYRPYMEDLATVLQDPRYTWS